MCWHSWHACDWRLHQSGSCGAAEPTCVVDGHHCCHVILRRCPPLALHGIVEHLLAGVHPHLGRGGQVQAGHSWLQGQVRRGKGGPGTEGAQEAAGPAGQNTPATVALHSPAPRTGSPPPVAGAWCGGSASPAAPVGMLLGCRHVDSGLFCPGSGSLADGGIWLAGLAPTTGQPLAYAMTRCCAWPSAAAAGGAPPAAPRPGAPPPPITGHPAVIGNSVRRA